MLGSTLAEPFFSGREIVFEADEFGLGIPSARCGSRLGAVCHYELHFVNYLAELAHVLCCSTRIGRRAISKRSETILLGLPIPYHLLETGHGLPRLAHKTGEP